MENLKIKQVISILGLLILSACASSQVSFFTTPPQAKIYAKPLGEGKRVLVGQTPLISASKNISQTVQSSGPLLLEFEKEGYETKSMVLSDLNVNNLLFNVELRPSFRSGDQQTMNWLIENAFDVQRLVKSQRYEEALKVLAEMRRVGPLVATTHEMIGGVYYVKRRYREAFDSYAEALKLNPKSAEAFKMTNLLKEVVGSRETASENQDKGSDRDSDHGPSQGEMVDGERIGK